MFLKNRISMNYGQSQRCDICIITIPENRENGARIMEALKSNNKTQIQETWSTLNRINTQNLCPCVHHIEITGNQRQIEALKEDNDETSRAFSSDIKRGIK